VSSISRLGRRLSAERGGIPISVLLVIAAAVVLVYAALSASSGDPDRYGRLAVPSNSLVELPSAEVQISYAQVVPAGAAAGPLPTDLRVIVTDPDTGEPLTVNSSGAEERTEEGEVFRPFARVDPPGAGTYEIQVTAKPSLDKPGQLALGESALGAVSDRFSKLGDEITGPYGVIAGVLLVAAFLVPYLRRRFHF
jgi:hypothetical protein